MVNDKIYELAKEAGLIEFESIPNSQAVTPNHESVVKARKFAKLIAQNCAELAMTQHASTSPGEYDEMEPYGQGCDDTASTISGLIRRTFGVD